MKYKMMDPQMIMGIVIALIMLAIGVFATFITLDAMSDMLPYSNATDVANLAINNTSNTANTVFNILGIVLVIGAIMTIVGLVYSYVKPGGY